MSTTNSGRQSLVGTEAAPHGILVLRFTGRMASMLRRPVGYSTPSSRSGRHRVHASTWSAGLRNRIRLISLRQP